MNCPFYREGQDYLSGRCLGAKECGTLMMVMMGDIKKSLKVK